MNDNSLEVNRQLLVKCHFLFSDTERDDESALGTEGLQLPSRSEGGDELQGAVGGQTEGRSEQQEAVGGRPEGGDELQGAAANRQVGTKLKKML